MNDPWFRMHANIGSKRVVWRLMNATGVSKTRAVGALAMFWGAVSLYCPQGNVADVPDPQLEEWAAWDGKRGAFASFVREQHSTGGVINDYQEYCGALEVYRKKVRDRVTKHRNNQNVTVTSALHDTPGNATVTVTKALPSSTGQDVRSTKKQKLTVAKNATVPDEPVLDTPTDPGAWPKSWAFDTSKALADAGVVAATGVVGQHAKPCKDTMPWPEWLRVLGRMSRDGAFKYSVPNALLRVGEYRDSAWVIGVDGNEAEIVAWVAANPPARAAS